MAYGRVNVGMALKRIKGKFFYKWSSRKSGFEITAFNHNEKLGINGDSNGWIHVFDLNTGEKVFFNGDGGERYQINAVCIDENNMSFANASGVQLYKLNQSGKLLWKLPIIPAERIISMQNTQTGIIAVKINGDVICFDKNANEYKLIWKKNLSELANVEATSNSLINKNGNIVIPVVDKTSNDSKLIELNHTNGTLKNSITIKGLTGQIDNFQMDKNGNYICTRGGLLSIFIVSKDNSFETIRKNLNKEISSGSIAYFFVDDNECIYLVLYSDKYNLYSMDFEGAILNKYRANLNYPFSHIMGVGLNEFIITNNVGGSSGYLNEKIYCEVYSK